MPRLVRDTVLFVVGLCLIVNEAVLRDGEPRFYLLVLYTSMIGLPAFLTSDSVSAIERFLRGRNGNGRNGHSPEPPSEPKPPPLAFLRTDWRPVWRHV